MSMHESRADRARDPYDVDDEAGSPDSDYPPPAGFSPEGDFKGFPRAEPSAAPPAIPRRRDLWLILAAIAVLAVAAVAAILAIGPSGDPGPDTPPTERAEPRATDPYPGAASDAMVRAQVGDCITFTDKDDEDSWRVVDCGDEAALGEVYGFALGTLDKDECPDPPEGSTKRYHFALDYRDSTHDDYVVCAAGLDD